MTTLERKIYQRLPKDTPAKHRHREAGILASWEQLEQAELVRFQHEPDDISTAEDLYGDMFNEKYADCCPGGLRTMRAQKKAYDKSIDMDGIWGIIGEYRLNPESEWEHGGSCWGFIGNEWSHAECDIKAETMHGLKSTLRSRQLLGM